MEDSKGVKWFVGLLLYGAFAAVMLHPGVQVGGFAFLILAAVLVFSILSRNTYQVSRSILDFCARIYRLSSLHFMDKAEPSERSKVFAGSIYAMLATIAGLAYILFAADASPLYTWRDVLDGWQWILSH